MSRVALVVLLGSSWLWIGCGDNSQGPPFSPDGPPSDGPDSGADGPDGADTPDGPIDAPIEKLAQRAYAKAMSPDAGDRFAARLAISRDGSTLAVSADTEDSAATGVGGDARDNSAADSGAVFLFARTGGGWRPQAYVKASNTGAEDLFGTSLALSDDGALLAVGARGEASGATGDPNDDSAPGAGAVYVFARQGQTWAQTAYLKATNAEGEDNFGSQVALSADGSTLAVAAENESSAATGVDGDPLNNEAPYSGAVYLFHRDGATWSQEAYLKASNTEEDDFFGSTLALSGDGAMVAVTAPGEDSGAAGVEADQLNNTAPEAGAVYLFARKGSEWKQQAYLKASNPEARDAFGRGLSLSSDGLTLAVSATGEDSAATGVDGDQSNNAASSAGAVYLFSRDGGTWQQRTYLKPLNTGTTDLFGMSVSLSGDGATLAVGATGEDSGARGVDGISSDESGANSGAVYLFRRTREGWSQRNYVKASNSDPGDRFGSCVVLSRDGATLVVSALDEASAASGVDGDQQDNSRARAGAAYVFR